MNRDLIDIYRYMLKHNGRATVRRIGKMYNPVYEIRICYEVKSGKKVFICYLPIHTFRDRWGSLGRLDF